MSTFLFKIIPFAYFTMLLTGISHPIANPVQGGIISFGSFLRSVSWGHASNVMRRCLCNKILSRGPMFCVSKNLWKGSNRTAVLSWKGSLTRDTPSIGDSDWLAAFALLPPANLPSSSWCGLSRQPDWALFWLCTCMHATGNHSWSIQTHGPNSTTRRTLGSLWGISCRWWVVCNNDANLALVFLERLCPQPRRIGHSPERSIFVVTPH